MGQRTYQISASLSAIGMRLKDLLNTRLFLVSIKGSKPTSSTLFISQTLINIKEFVSVFGQHIRLYVVRMFIGEDDYMDLRTETLHSRMILRTHQKAILHLFQNRELQILQVQARDIEKKDPIVSLDSVGNIITLSD